MNFKETGDACALANAKDSRKTSYDLSYDYSASIDSETWMVTNSSYGKVGGKGIETFIDSFNKSL